MEDTTEASLVQQLLQKNDGGHTAVVVPNHVGDVSGLDRSDHSLCFRGGAPQGLFAQHHLARLGGSDGDFRVGVVGACNVDQVDVFSFDQGSPVCLNRLIAPVFRKPSDPLGTARAYGLEYRSVGQIEEPRRLQKGVRMGAAHETVADQSDIYVGSDLGPPTL